MKRIICLVAVMLMFAMNVNAESIPDLHSMNLNELYELWSEVASEIEIKQGEVSYTFGPGVYVAGRHFVPGYYSITFDSFAEKVEKTSYGGNRSTIRIYSDLSKLNGVSDWIHFYTTGMTGSTAVVATPPLFNDGSVITIEGCNIILTLIVGI